MEEDNHLAKFTLEKSKRRPKEVAHLIETSYKIVSDRYDHRKFPYITFVDNNRKIQVCDMERYFYIIPTHNTGTQKVTVSAYSPNSEDGEDSPSQEQAEEEVKETKQPDSRKKGEETRSTLTYSEGIYPC
jgi:hypothetical protein